MLYGHKLYHHTDANCKCVHFAKIVLCYKSNVFSCLFPFFLSVLSPHSPPRSSLCVAQMNRPIQVKPADSESRGGRFPLLFFLLPFLFLSTPSCHTTSVSPLPVDVPFLRVTYNDASRWDLTVIQGPRGSWAGPHTPYISVVTTFVGLLSSNEVLWRNIFLSFRLFDAHTDTFV